MTPQRMAILKALLSEEHPTVQQIYGIVRREFPMTSLVTVYRTIAVLRDAGQVLEVGSIEPLPHYDCLRPACHPHLICTACGRVVDSPDLNLGPLTEVALREMRDWVLSQRVLFFGLCPACQAERTSAELRGGEGPKNEQGAAGRACEPSAESSAAD